MAADPVHELGGDLPIGDRPGAGPTLPELLQSRMVTACEWWLGWCGANGVDPLGADFDDLERAARQMHADRVSTLKVLDLLDQVGHMLRLWRDPRWTRLRRTIEIDRQGAAHAHGSIPSASAQPSTARARRRPER